MLLHTKFQGSAELQERFKLKSFSITIKCFLLLIVAVWSCINVKNCITVLVQLDLYLSCLWFLPVFAPPLPSLCFIPLSVLTALALAMGRDNVSGGIAHLVVITEKGVEHVVVPGDKLPKFHDEWLPFFFFFFCFMEKSFWIPEPQFYHSDLFSDIWKISFPSWETECWNRGVTTGLVKMIICRIVITKPWSFHYHKQGFSAFYASKQHVLCRFFFNVRKYVKFK